MGISRADKVFLGITLFSLLIITLAAVFYYNTNNENSIDNVNMIEGTHLSGNITIEVDYMQGCRPTDAQLLEITELFAQYDLNVTFIVDEQITKFNTISDADVVTFFVDEHNLNTDSYMFIASKHNDEHILGGAFSKDLSVIYIDTIYDTFDDITEDSAFNYVVMHEIGHLYGCNHSGNTKDVMYPYLSESQLIVTPEPQFIDSNSLVELLN
jgi:hypothetical protein